MTEQQWAALILLRNALKVCEEYGVSIEHDLDHLNLSVKGEETMHKGHIGSAEVQAYLDGER